MRFRVHSNATGVHLEGLAVIAIQLLHMLSAAEGDFKEELLQLGQLRAHLQYSLGKAKELKTMKPSSFTPFL